MPRTTSQVAALQGPLRAQYKTDPTGAQVVDHAATLGENPMDPFHSMVAPAPEHEVTLPVGVHRALGGPHDGPTPGDILCSALAACLDSTIRLVANILGITLESLSVNVTASVDVRGTLGVSEQVPVGFQAMRCRVDLKPVDGTSPERVQRLLATAERSCIVLQTLRSGVAVDTVVG